VVDTSPDELDAILPDIIQDIADVWRRGQLQGGPSGPQAYAVDRR